MIKKFEEFVNEGLISDYKKQKEAESREVSNSDKKFVLDVLQKLNEVEMPFVFIGKNCAIINGSVNKDKVAIERNKIHNIDEALDMDSNDIHITEKSVLQLLDEKSEWIADGLEYKNIWNSIYKWFDKAFEKMELKFAGKIKVCDILDLKADLKKELF